MLGKAADRYNQVRASTSTPGELLLALYDGLFRFLNGARTCFENNQAARGRELAGKARAVITELLLALDHAAAPDLCANLAAVYDFALARLSDVNRDANPAHIAEVGAPSRRCAKPGPWRCRKAMAEANVKKGK